MSGPCYHPEEGAEQYSYQKRATITWLRSHPNTSKIISCHFFFPPPFLFFLLSFYFVFSCFSQDFRASFMCFSHYITDCRTCFLSNCFMVFHRRSTLCSWASSSIDVYLGMCGGSCIGGWELVEKEVTLV